MKGVFFNLDFNKIEQAKDLSLVTYREDWKIPKIENPHQVRVKTLLGGICGSDLHQIFLEVSYFSSILASDINPSPLGHEFLGIIAEVGPSVENLKKGDRVIMNPISHCDSRGLDLCSSCKNGNWSQCINLSDNGWVMGSHSQYLVTYEKQFYKVADAITDEIGILAEPLAVAIHVWLETLQRKMI